jgi:hypothetical protein
MLCRKPIGMASAAADLPGYRSTTETGLVSTRRSAADTLSIAFVYVVNARAPLQRRLKIHNKRYCCFGVRSLTTYRYIGLMLDVNRKS